MPNIPDEPHGDRQPEQLMGWSNLRSSITPVGIAGPSGTLD